VEVTLLWVSLTPLGAPVVPLEKGRMEVVLAKSNW
jgi:hypothetical protein